MDRILLGVVFYIRLNKCFSLFLLIFFLFLGNNQNVNAQCTITANTNANALSCGSAPISGCGGVLYIGDGITTMSLRMNANLNLSCLGAIQFIVRDKATLDFSSGNFDLSLAAGSSIQFQTGSNLTGGGSCSASDRIKIGGSLVSSCNGGGGPSVLDFTTLLSQGGYNVVNATAPSAVCGSGSFSLNATATPSSGASIKWYTVSSGGTPVATGSSYSTPVISSTTTYYVEAYYSSTGYTTPRKAVTVTVNPTSVGGTVSGSTSRCTAVNSTTFTLSGQTGNVLRWESSTDNFAISSSIANTTSSLTVTNVTTTTSYRAVVKSGNCASAYSSVGTISAGAPVATAVSGVFCTGFTANWNKVTGATTYLLDASTDGFATFVSGLNGKDVGDNSIFAVTGLTAGQSYSYRIWAVFPCGVYAVSSNSISVTTSALPVVAAIAGGSATVCVGSSTPAFTDATAGGVWSITSGTGTASITAGGIVTGATAGTVTVVYTITSGSCSNTATKVLTVNALPTPTLSSNDADNVFCSGTSVTFTAGGGNNYDFRVNGASVQNSASGTYTTTTLTNGQTLSVVVGNASGCMATSAGIINTVNVTPAAPTVLVISQPSCVLSTGSVDLGGLVAGNWTINPGGINGNTGTTTISGLAGGTYNFTVTDGTCTSVPSADVVINSLTTNVWDGATWSTGSPPNGSQNIVFDGNFIANADVDGCSCQVNSGNVVVNSGNTLTITNAINVSGGTLTFENNASLVQTNNVANTGNIIYKRNTNVIGKFDYTYWSSPVAPQKLVNVSPGTLSDKFFSFNADANNWKLENSNNAMSSGVGYIIRGPQSYVSPAIYQASFIGVPNNGSVTVNVTGANRYCLIGNPYPSALDADAFLAANFAVLDGTLYFWTHNTAIANYSYSWDDYASYNTLGGVGTKAITTGVNTSIPTGKIAAGQAFFASTKAAGVILFTNNMRQVGANSLFFKGVKSKGTPSLEKHRLWLNLTNGPAAFKQTLIGYVTGATNEYDKSFDGSSFNGNSSLDFYSVNQGTNLVIQGRALPFSVSDEVPLGYKTTLTGTFMISIDHADGLLSDQSVYLVDKKMGIVFNLKQGAYSFTTAKGTFNDRFVLRYANDNAAKTNLAVNGKNGNLVLVSVQSEGIIMNSISEKIANVMVYDLSGRLIYQKNNVDSYQFSVSNLGYAQQVVIVKMVLKDGSVDTQEIVIQ